MRYFRLQTLLAPLALLIASVTPAVSVASDDALARLQAFTAGLESFTAEFEQTLYDADSNPLQQLAGTVVLKRPGRFVWEYDGEGGQYIVADGERIWLYDRELEQVTVTGLDDRISGTPLVLLMGNQPLEEEFEIAALGSSDGIEWFELLPREQSADFQSVYIGLAGQSLAAMELRDNFGQATQILFTAFIANQVEDDTQFRFTPPDGVDVLGADVAPGGSG